MQIELKPCPFCGAEAVTRTYRTTDNGHWITKNYVECTGCHVELPTHLASENKEKAAEAWNRRINNAKDSD